MGSSPSMGYTMDTDATSSASVLLLLFSRTQLCSTLRDPMDCSTPGFLCFTNSRSLFKLMSIELVMLFNHLILCCFLLLLPSIFPRIRVFSSTTIWKHQFFGLQSILTSVVVMVAQLWRYIKYPLISIFEYNGILFNHEEKGNLALYDTLSQHQGLFQWIGSLHQLANI